MSKHTITLTRTDKLVLCFLFLYAVLSPGLAFAPPPPPAPPVPAGNMFTEYAVSLGIAGYGAYRLWRAKRSLKKKDELRRR